MASVSKRISAATGKVTWITQWRDPATRRGRTKSFPTQKAAKQHAAAVETTIGAGTYIDPKTGRQTLQALVPGYLRSRQHLAPATQEITAQFLRCHVQPRWGNTKLIDFNRRDIQAWVYELEDSGLSTSSVRKAHSLLKQLLSAAVRDGIIITNPSGDIDLPRRAEPAHASLTAAQIRLLLESIHRDEYRELALFLVTTGCRIGEVFALTWADIDFATGTAVVDKAVATVDGAAILGPTKTRRARMIAVPQVTLDVLAARRGSAGDDDLIFPGRDGGHRAHKSDNTWLRTATRRARAVDPDFPASLTVHSLRHIAASLLLSTGVPVKIAAEQLGHADASMTLNVYAKILPGDLDRAAAAMQGALSAPVITAEIVE